MFCNKCGAELSNDSAFCHKCGSPVEVNEKLRCPKCGGYVEDSNQTYCDNCGANLKRDNEWRRSVKNDFKVENESVTFRSSSTPFNSKPAGNTTGAIMGIIMTTFMSLFTEKGRTAAKRSLSASCWISPATMILKPVIRMTILWNCLCLCRWMRLRSR